MEQQPESHLPQGDWIEIFTTRCNCNKKKTRRHLLKISKRIERVQMHEKLYVEVIQQLDNSIAHLINNLFSLFCEQDH